MKPVKSQGVRVFDIVVLMPAMVIAGSRLAKRERNGGLGLFMVFAGIGTGLYNLSNYQRIEKRMKARAHAARLKARGKHR